MKTKKPRSAKAVKTAVRVVRRVARRKPKPPRREASPAKAKRAKSKTSKQAATIARRKARPAARIKAVSKRVVRKPRARDLIPPVESEQPVTPLVPIPAPEPEPVPPEQAEAIALPSPGLAALYAAVAADQTEASGLPDQKEPGEQPAQPEPGLRIPAILLEGDAPVSPAMTGPGQKYAVGPTTPKAQSGREEAGLPEAYATGKLALVARDPHWLYAHWDFAPEQQQRYNALSADHHLVLRVHPGTMAAPAAKEVPVHPESRHWFIHVDRADTRYVAELGYYPPRRQWVTVATSAPAMTPAAMVSTDQTVRFATIPAHVPLAELTAFANQEIPADMPPLEAARERALVELVSQYLAHRDWGNSAEIPELVSHLGEPGIAPAQFPLPAPLGGEAESGSSPMSVAEPPPSGFRFSINAELVIYGATEPGASVTIGGRPIPLRPDGSFSCRCSLPDGDHTVTVSAVSAQGDSRQAELNFSRQTVFCGDVSVAPPDQTLEPPAAQNP